ncbi:L-2-hydroxyglutarate oxidase LhgO [Planctomycetes bacterium Poly30]|uniref:L-2-hydroxyglutarate oxidase LhgO n=1 Tax=Saltatorellus ferox TaxID=2528018 RepID=A0A518ERC0_9BACT|nr:L-2-hydroxyglutarate oxidase LhgO [Planctomycetes bacterium Poly30]
MSRILIAGGGILGLTAAWEALQRDSGTSVVVLEKESSVATHQTGRNSGVIHSGLYYQPGSMKAETCRSGKGLLEAFCQDHRVAMDRCGKVVVATDESELPRLATLEQRATANGVESRRIDLEELRSLEPHVAGIAALHVPETGIVDYLGVCKTLQRLIEATGRGTVRTGVEVSAFEPMPDGKSVKAHLADGSNLEGTHAVNCAGLHCDRLARRSGASPTARIVPFRGEYFRLVPDAEHLVRNLIYPVPAPRFPFLGVHFTRMVHGGIECGPNAVFALAREGYTWGDISARDLASAFSWPGTWRLFARHWKTGLGETRRSLSRAAFVKALQRLVPEIRQEHLIRIPAGVRAQALTRDGALLDDFALESQGPILHVLNAPSPAATASFAIARHILDRLNGRLLA